MGAITAAAAAPIDCLHAFIVRLSGAPLFLQSRGRLRFILPLPAGGLSPAKLITIE